MTTLVLRGLAARRLRSALTAVSILLGVAMVTGTYVLTDQIRAAFDDIQSRALEGVDVVVEPRQAFGSDFTEPATIGETLVARLRGARGVEARLRPGRSEWPARGGRRGRGDRPGT